MDFSKWEAIFRALLTEPTSAFCRLSAAAAAEMDRRPEELRAPSGAEASLGPLGCINKDAPNWWEAQR